MAAVAHCDAAGVIRFCEDRDTPTGVLIFARHSNQHELEAIVSRKARLAYDGSPLVPGVPEARNQEDGRAALETWRDWSFQHYRIVNGAALVTDDADEVAP